LDAKGAYQLMSDALRAAGRPVLFSLCEWGSHKPWRWAREIGHSWRSTGDIGVGFTKLLSYYKPGQWHPLTVMEIIHQNDTLRQYAGPGHWNDPDMLEVGNRMTKSEDRAHFTMWCMMAAPLILGNDIRNMSESTREIVMNRDLIAVDQDSLGIQGLHYSTENGLEFWFKPLSDEDWALTILNPTDSDVVYPMNWQHFNLTDSQVSGRSTDFNHILYRVKNLWTGRYEGKTSLKDETWWKLTIRSHDVLTYRLYRNFKQ
jgi:alpha-galactosidase